MRRLYQVVVYVAMPCMLLGALAILYGVYSIQQLTQVGPTLVSDPSHLKVPKIGP